MKKLLVSTIRLTMRGTSFADNCEIPPNLGGYIYIACLSDGLAPVGMNSKYGFIDKTGKEVVPLKYHRIDEFYNDLALAKLDGKMFFIDKQGNYVKDFE
ncbi:WG repeat-containing protein [Faucicola boevrei]|uniref:WG repeat-containing protein n=1 Tax=Faucicola boevrei TaxID=346665 RepID=UPI00036C62EA|nr:WG repeat-containing protein [Moraxella boevrei]